MTNKSHFQHDNNGQLQPSDHTERVVWPDILRIAAVFAMIMLHAASAGFGTFGARTVCWQVCNFYDSLTRFCVPVFVMVSGVFLLNPQKEYSLKKLYFTKLTRIATAFIFWTTFYFAVHLFDLWLENGNHFSHIGRSHMWFLFMISGLYIITPILRLIAKDEKVSRYFLVLGFVFVYCVNMLNLFPPMRKLLSHTINRLDVKLVAGFSCYFLLGYWLSTHTLSATSRKFIYIMGIFATVGTIVLNGLAGYHFNVTGVWMYGNLLPNILMMSTAVFVFCRYHCWQLSLTWQKRIGLIGRLSFGIYLVHAFFIDHMYWFGFPHFLCHPIISIPVTTVTVFFASLAVVFCLDKIPVINKYIM